MPAPKKTNAEATHRKGRICCLSGVDERLSERADDVPGLIGYITEFGGWSAGPRLCLPC
jgi:hypothetical protein